MRSFSPIFRTDLAAELVKTKPVRLNEHVKRVDVTLSAADADRLGKPAGRYTTLLSPVIASGAREYYPRLTSALSGVLKEFVGSPETCMIVGLGNPSMTADALGDSVAKRVVVTRGIETDDGSGVCTLSPGVLGVTGIESFDVILGAASRVKPDLILVVDSLCAASGDRLASAFQVSDAGITPGSGVSNFRRRIDRQTMGVPVVSVGVPLVVYASTLVRDAGGNPDENGELIVTPKDVDLIVEECAAVIASAINKSLGF